jgi:hypothetical protein
MENRIVEAFDRLDERRHDGPLIEVLRQRLLAELFGDGAGVAATLAPGFGLVMHAGDASMTLAADAVIGSVDAQAAAEVLLWTEFDDLVVDATVVAGSGTLCRAHLAGATLTTTPLAFFLRFNGQLMASEVAFIGGHSETTAIDTSDLPSVERLRSRLGSSGDG